MSKNPKPGHATGDHPRPDADGPETPRHDDPARQPPRAGIIDRRMWPDRRRLVVDGTPMNPDGTPRTEESGFERRRGPGRRLSDFTRAAEEGEMTKEQFLFLMAIDEFKKANGRAFPTWTDVLEVIRLLGYRKTCPSEISLRRAEDWREAHDAPSNVRPHNWHDRPNKGHSKAA